LENLAMAKHLKISGRVQGVGYRYSMSEEAERLGVTGWVRNRRDGTVEAVLDGAPDAVDAILAWARRGPRGAHVTDVEVVEIPGTFERFDLRHTG
jgi:acylphosphatase